MVKHSSSQKFLIAPSILSADFSKLGTEIETVQKAGADWLHVDVMDGHFVPNITIGPVVVHWIRQATPLFLDVHLMISEPQKYIPEFAESGADSLTFHCEATAHPREVVQMIHRLRKKAGVSLKPKTPISKIIPLLPYVDLVLVMTVEPGFGGQKFMPEILPKIRSLSEIIEQKKLKCKIEVDGGINADTALLARQQGAQIFVAGNSIFAQKSAARALQSLRSILDNPR